MFVVVMCAFILEICAFVTCYICIIIYMLSYVRMKWYMCDLVVRGVWYCFLLGFYYVVYWVLFICFFTLHFVVLMTMIWFMRYLYNFYCFLCENKLIHVWFCFEKGLIQVFLVVNECHIFVYLCVTLVVFLLYFYHIILLMFSFFPMVIWPTNDIYSCFMFLKFNILVIIGWRAVACDLIRFLFQIRMLCLV